MNLRKLLLDDFGVDLPIKGGMGNSIDNPIIIVKEGNNDYVGTEFAVLRYLGIGRGIEWKTLRQELLTHHSRQIDKVKIETTQITEEQIINQVENFYFDITDCL